MELKYIKLANIKDGMKVFISGGAGFIGSQIAEVLEKDISIEKIIIYDNFSSGTLAHLDKIIKSKKLHVINGDIKNLELLIESTKNIDLVIHLAANPDISKAITQPDIDFWEGTYLTQNILESMRLNNIRRILYTSGSGVYGEVDGEIFKESFGPCYPISTYGASKLACEALISSYCYMFEMKGRAFRFANVVGPKQTHGVGFDFIRKLKKDNTEISILGDGSQSKSYIFVDDVISAMLIVLNEMNRKNSSNFDIYNVATDDYITVTEIADIACTLSNLNPQSVKYNYSGGKRGWKGDVPKVLFNVDKIKSLGWVAKKTAREAIRTSIELMRTEIYEAD
jgi:UDP-glucose 4-epimerase